jgi:hypothetical protein
VQSRLVFLLALAAATAPAGASWGFNVATDPSTGDELRWDHAEPLEYRLQQDFGGGLPPLRVQGVVRSAFETWTSLPTSDVQVQEGPIFRGPACPHAMPADMAARAEQICGEALPDPDGESVIFWIETLWPFDTAVIGLTTLTWAEGGQIVDADIALNGLDYTWTMDEEAVQTDLPTILVHEIGHFFGLDHTDAPAAVMRVDYEQGDRVLTLGQDDIDGLAHLYPCPSGRCSTEVGFVEGSSCSTGGGAGPLAALAGLLLGAGLLRGRRQAAAPLLALLLLPATADTSVVVALDAGDLAARADAVVRATVVGVEPSLQGIVWSEIRLEVSEVLAGEAPEEVVLWQPGGIAGGYGTKAFGMPDFVEGEDVVAFLAFDPEGGPRVVGLAQGKATIDPDGGLRRDLRGLDLAYAAEAGPVRTAAIPADLDGLRAALR